MEIKPLGDRVLLKPMEEEEKTKSGIVIPDTAKEKPQKEKSWQWALEELWTMELGYP